MKRRIVAYLLASFGLITGLGLALLGPEPGRGAEQRVEAVDIWLRGTDFAGGELENLLVGTDGLLIPAGPRVARYTSAELIAPQPFNALVPRWLAALPAGMELNVLVRTRPATGPWSAWIRLPASHDMTQPGDVWTTGDMLTVSAEDSTHAAYQFRLEIRNPSGAATGRVEQLRLTLIDATGGPSSAELAGLAAESVPPTIGGYPKPPVTGRDSWCTDPRCADPANWQYAPVTHLIVHHTATSNNSSDWAAVVRAIWFYHTFTLGWGDIGYHYLVDADGVIYEGHAGGDDVIGIHASVANTGSMGVALIGDFTANGIDPPALMLDSTAELLAWKADQKGIDIFDAGMLPNMDWGLTYLTGHRDVAGSTLCPGDRAHTLLPSLRDEVAGRLNFQPPHIYYDELDPETHFNLGNGTWVDGTLGCGFNTHAYYALSTQDPGGNVQSATWQPDIAHAGRYELSVLAPFCNTGLPDTTGAEYEVVHAAGIDTVQVDQAANLGLWVPLGEYLFTAGTGNLVTLSNLTATDNDAGVWFDALRLRRLGPTATNLMPPAGAWLPGGPVTFTWSVSDPPAVLTQTWQVATDASFADIIHRSPPIPAGVMTYTHPFSADHDALYWQVILTDTLGGGSLSAPTQFGVDVTPPDSAVSAAYRVPGNRYLIHWLGSDAGSGVAGYHVAYRAAGEPSWTPWLTNTTATATWFTPPLTGTVYWFYSQGVDQVGNVEPAPAGEGDLSTDQAIFLPHAIMLPAIKK
jgi:hypothetical protein